MGPLEKDLWNYGALVEGINMMIVEGTRLLLDKWCKEKRVLVIE